MKKTEKTLGGKRGFDRFLYVSAFLLLTQYVFGQNGDNFSTKYLKEHTKKIEDKDMLGIRIEDFLDAYVDGLISNYDTCYSNSINSIYNIEQKTFVNENGLPVESHKLKKNLNEEIELLQIIKNSYDDSNNVKARMVVELYEDGYYEAYVERKNKNGHLSKTKLDPYAKLDDIINAAFYFNVFND